MFGSYTQAFNKAYRRTGTLFEGRFQAILVDSERYLCNLCRYIHVNPVKHGLVAFPEDWPYSNYLEWVGRRRGGMVEPAFIRGYFPSPEAYIAFVRQSPGGWAARPPALPPYLDELE